MSRETEREDVEILAKALCRACETGARRNSQDFNWEDAINKAVEEKWKEWIPKAQKLADEVYGQLLDTCQNTYRKHVMEDASIGWEALGEQLANALVGTMGDDKYNEWLDNLEGKKV